MDTEKKSMHWMKEVGLRLARKFVAETAEDTGVRLTLNAVKNGKAFFRRKKSSPILLDILLALPAERIGEVIQWLESLPDEDVKTLTQMSSEQLKNLFVLDAEVRAKVLLIASKTAKHEVPVSTVVDNPEIIGLVQKWTEMGREELVKFLNKNQKQS